MRKNLTIAGQDAGFIEYVIAADELQIIDVFVQPKYRRQGLAETVLRELFAKNKHLASVYLEVRVSNTAAQNLYTKLGFEKIGIRKNYYSKPVEEAVLMQKKLHGFQN